MGCKNSVANGAIVLTPCHEAWNKIRMSLASFKCGSPFPEAFKPSIVGVLISKGNSENQFLKFEDFTMLDFDKISS